MSHDVNMYMIPRKNLWTCSVVGMPYELYIYKYYQSSGEALSRCGAPAACGSKKLQNDTKEVCHLTMVGRIPRIPINDQTLVESCAKGRSQSEHGKSIVNIVNVQYSIHVCVCVIVCLERISVDLAQKWMFSTFLSLILIISVEHVSPPKGGSCDWQLSMLESSHKRGSCSSPIVIPVFIPRFIHLP